MGHLYPQYVIGQIYHGDEKLDKLVAKSDGLIIKINGKANGEVTYFMAWDGSKEGWETSDRFDRIRERFLNRLKKLEAHWYEIKDDYEMGSGVALITYINPDKVVWDEVK